MLSLLFVLLALLGCAPCTPFDTMVLDEPESLAPIVADFAAWTGRDGVCVPAVEIVAEIEEDPHLAGQYAGPGEPILLAEAETYRVALFHELCHALDAEEGLSADFPDPGPIYGPAYDTPELRRAEAFAQACEHGPAAVAFEAALAEHCGVDADPDAAWVRAEVYPYAPPDPAVSVGPTPTAAPLADLDPGVIVAAEGEADGAWLRLAHGGAVHTAWWPDPDAPSTAAAQPEAARDGTPAPRGGPPAPVAWTGATEAATGPDGAALWTWYAHGIAGAALGDATAYTLVTDCTTGLSGAVPTWLGATPAAFSNVPTRHVWRW